MFYHFTKKKNLPFSISCPDIHASEPLLIETIKTISAQAALNHSVII